MVLELNASDDRGIEVVREQIKTFASTKQIFTAAPTSSTRGGLAGYKLIILDEADAMTNTAQMALRRIMEKYTANTRFCIIANYAHKLSPALLSRCTRFRFSPLKEPDIRHLVERVIDEENVKILPAAADALVTLSRGDMRRALNVLQACHASSESWAVLFVSGLADAGSRRHATPGQGCTARSGQGHCAGRNHDRDHLQLRCGAAAGGHPRDPGRAPHDHGRDVVPVHHQQPEGGARPGAG